MKTFPLLAVAALAATLCTTAARASDAHVTGTLRIGLPLPWMPPVAVVPMMPVHLSPGWRDRDRDGVPDWRDRHDNRRHGHHLGHHLGWRAADRDRDGIPDWRDRHVDRRGHGPGHGHGHGGHDGRDPEPRGWGHHGSGR